MDSTTASSAGPSPYWTQQQQHRGDVGELSPEQMLRQQQQQLEAQQEAATDALRELAGENAELYARLDQMYQLFHEVGAGPEGQLRIDGALYPVCTSYYTRWVGPQGQLFNEVGGASGAAIQRGGWGLRGSYAYR